MSRMQKTAVEKRGIDYERKTAAEKRRIDYDAFRTNRAGTASASGSR